MTIERDMERAKERLEAFAKVAALLVEAIEAIPCAVGAECESSRGWGGDEYRCKFHRLAREAELTIP